MLVPLALAVLELASLNPAIEVMGLFQRFSPKVCPSGYVMNWDWITDRQKEFQGQVSKENWGQDP